MWLETGFVVGGTFILFALTRSDNLALTHDSLTYLADIEAGGARLFHPHHLLYNAAAALWLSAGQLLGLASHASSAVALLNSAFGAFAAGVFHALLRHRTRVPRRLAVCATIGASVSFGFWFYSVSVEVYLLPLLFLLVTLYSVLAPNLTHRRVFVVGLLHGVAMLGHQIHVLFGLVLIAALWLRRTNTAFSFKRAIGLYVAGGAIVVLAGYGAVLLAVIRPSNLADAWTWFTLYAQGESYWAGLSVSALAKAAMGLSRALVGGHFAFALPSVQEAMTAAFPGKSLVDEAFLVRGLPTYALYLLFAGGTLFGLGFAAVTVRGVLRRRQMSAEARPLAQLAALWIGIYSAFFLFWQPYNVEFWIPQATALWMLLALLWTDTSQPPTGASRASTFIGLMAALLFIVNLFGVILPATNTANDVYAQRYELLAGQIAEGDLVLVDHPHVGIGYARRLTNAEPISLLSPFQTDDPPSVEQAGATLIRRVENALQDGHKVFIEPSLMTLDDGMDDGKVAQQLNTHFGSRWVELRLSADFEYYVLEPILSEQPP